MFKRIWKAAFDFIFPPRCVICGELLEIGDDVFCEECRMAYLAATNETCYICGRKYRKCLCSTEDLRDFRISRLVKLFRYQKETRELPRSVNQVIFHMKKERDFPCRDFLAAELSRTIQNELPVAVGNSSYLLTFAPRSRAQKLKYGHDQSEILGNKIAKQLNIRFCDALKRKRKTKVQKKFRRNERFENMKGAYTVKKGAEVRGKRVFLVDDVVTTGASLGNAAKALYKAGAKEVIGVVIAVRE